MRKKVYLVCENDVKGRASHRGLAKALLERGFEYESIVVSQRIVEAKPAISSDFFFRMSWLCFSSPDSVDRFFELFGDFETELVKTAAKDLATAIALAHHGVKVDLIPVKPLHLRRKVTLFQAEKMLVGVDGQEWRGLEAHINIVLTSREKLTWKAQQEGIFLLSSPREAECFLQEVPQEGIFLCKNPETAEKCWQNNCRNVILPTDFTSEGLLTKLQEIS